MCVSVDIHMCVCVDVVYKCSLYVILLYHTYIYGSRLKSAPTTGIVVGCCRHDCLVNGWK